jgi:alkanesulfonate monooxygenase SsuD/methylene tetrahydromethanopterin reductase-like flavin-dependent oxidoreductase (luciferase family)
VGSPKTVKKQIIELTDRYNTNEIMILPNVYGAQNRMKAIELMAEVFD